MLEAHSIYLKNKLPIHFEDLALDDFVVFDYFRNALAEIRKVQQICKGIADNNGSHSSCRRFPVYFATTPFIVFLDCRWFGSWTLFWVGNSDFFVHCRDGQFVIGGIFWEFLVWISCSIVVYFSHKRLLTPFLRLFIRGVHTNCLVHFDIPFDFLSYDLFLALDLTYIAVENRI